MTHGEMIAVIAAHRDGKAIQFCSFDMGGEWRDADHPAWDFANYNYRIKPEPREWWVNTYVATSPAFTQRLYWSRKEADENAAPGRVECVHVREVIPC